MEGCGQGGSSMTVQHKTTTQIEPYYYTVHDRAVVIEIVNTLIDECTSFQVHGNGFGRGAKITVRFNEDRRVIEDILKARKISS